MSDHVTVSRTEYEQLCRDAEAWRLLESSPHVAELLGEWIEWDRRRTLSDSTAGMAAAIDWRAVSTAPTYAELQRRRGGTAGTHRCDWKQCSREGQPYRSPASGAPISLCSAHSHHGRPEATQAAEEVAA